MSQLAEVSCKELAQDTLRRVCRISERRGLDADIEIDIIYERLEAMGKTDWPFHSALYKPIRKHMLQRIANFANLNFILS